jgi:L-lactate dehydrogenase complex protein LldF
MNRDKRNAEFIPPENFRQRIRRSLANETLQLALDANAARRKASRQVAFTSLPDLQERRARAHAVKAEVVAHLEGYLAQFIQRVEANGIHVHRAKDAQEAVRIVLKIVNDSPQSLKDSFVNLRDRCGEEVLIAKSKSMVSEEIELNHALEAAGCRVVETDLGEYIVQLRGERPAHIITPAVHLRRQEVGVLFAEKLGMPYTEDIPTLTNTARKVLREVFLNARVGISGVNFGVVESGTLCLVTNEGNGRMVTTLPSVHIALMGIERLVPTLDDLALFLSLLPRSATGQKLSVYTSLIHAPLPGQTRHLILLDNGRLALRASPLAESLYCIRCGACLNACPVFRELGGHAYGSIYPGPIGSVISSALVDPQFDYLAQASSLCGACREACPVDIDLPGLLLRVRAGSSPRRTQRDTKLREQKEAKQHEGAGIPLPVKLGLKSFRLAASTPRLFAALQTLGGLLTHLLSPRRAYLHLPAWTGWGYSKDFPRLAVRPFRARWKEIGGREQRIESREQRIESREQGAERREQRGESREDGQEVVERFVQELTALGGKVERVSADELAARLQAFLAEAGATQALTDDTVAPLLGKAAVRRPDPGIPVGVTGALCAIAETGSLVLVSGAGETLTASLLPPVHAVILKASQIVPTVAEALARPEVRHARAGVIITGPSRTADIEMALTIGVHGPGKLTVFLVDER